MTATGLLAGQAAKRQAFAIWPGSRAATREPGRHSRTMRNPDARPGQRGTIACDGRTGKLSSVADKGCPWRPGTATGIGSMPGGNPLEAARMIFDELPDLPFLAELPGPGP